MGRSAPSRKIREAVCANCDSKCDLYEEGCVSYSPAKGHSIPRASDLMPEAANMHEYCIHYITSGLYRMIEENPFDSSNL